MFSEILPDRQIEEFSRLANDYQSVESALSTAEARKENARKRYEEHSPLGVVSRWFKDDVSKRISLSLKADLDGDERRVVTIKAQLDQLGVRLKEFTREFLLSAMRQERLSYLGTQPSAIQQEIARKLTKLSAQLDELWLEHSSRQLKSIAEFTKLADDLGRHYKDGNTPKR